MNTDNHESCDMSEHHYREYIDFLNRHRVQKGTKMEITNTGLGRRDIGAYHIPHSEYMEFQKLYITVLQDGKYELNINERQKPVGPMCFDIDFEYDKKERQYLTEDLENIAIKIKDVILKYYDMEEVIKSTEQSDFEIFVFEKDEPTIKGNKCKDGFHFIIPNAFNLAMRFLIYDEVKELILKEKILENIKYANPYDSVVDESVVNRNGWMMYGAKKPSDKGGKLYKLTHIYDVNIDDRPLESYDDEELVYLLSMRRFELDDAIKIKKEYVDEEFTRNLKVILKKYRKSTPIPLPDQLIEFDVPDMAKRIYAQENEAYMNNEREQNPTETNETTKDDKKKKKERGDNDISNIYLKQANYSASDNDVELAKKLTDILDVERAEVYESWINVCWALHNIDHERLFDTFIEFSKKCKDKYSRKSCEEAWNKSRNEGLSIGSLIWWAKKDNLEKFNVVMKEHVIKHIQMAASSGTQSLIARALYEQYKTEFKCASIKNHAWYQFVGHGWRVIDHGVTLLKIMSDSFTNDLLQSISSQIRSGNTTDFYSQNKNTFDTLKKLGTNAFKEGVLRECEQLFYDPEIEEKFDSNIDLLGFKNGVFDLKLGVFRPGNPDDYIMMNTGYNYENYNGDEPVFKEINDFFASIHPNKEIMEYTLKLISSYLDGHNREQQFTFWTGVGCHDPNDHVLRYDSSIAKVCDVKIGDKLMGNDFRPRTVKHIFSGEEEMFKVTINDSNKTTHIFNRSHRLALRLKYQPIVELDKECDCWKVTWIEYIEQSPYTEVKFFEDNSKYSHELAEKFSIDIKTKIRTINDNDVFAVTINDFINLDESIKKCCKIVRNDINSTRIDEDNYIYKKIYNEIKDDIATGTIIAERYNIGELTETLTIAGYDFEVNGTKIENIVKNNLEYDFTIESLENGKYVGFSVDGNQKYLMSDLCQSYNSNGKSVTVKILAKAFGKYAGVIDSTIVTRKRGGSSNATPELADKRGVRLIVLQEPEYDDKIQVGRMKEYTGGDKIQARALYGPTFYYTPQFRLIMLCNDLPRMSSSDGGVWRRAIVIKHGSKFVNNPNPNNKNEKQMDPTLVEKADLWKQPLMWLLLNKYYAEYRKNGFSIEIPKQVREHTNKYKTDSDKICEFIGENLIATGDDSDSVEISQLYVIFKEWYKSNTDERSVPMDKKQLKDYFEKNNYTCGPNKICGIRTKDDEKENNCSIMKNTNEEIITNK